MNGNDSKELSDPLRTPHHSEEPYETLETTESAQIATNGDSEADAIDDQNPLKESDFKINNCNLTIFLVVMSLAVIG